MIVSPTVRHSVLALLVLLVSGCVGVPSAEDVADEVGRREHPRVLARFGGAVDDPTLAAYVATVGRRLEVASSEATPDVRYTVLDAAIPNAFSLPGNYVYVTRGLLVLVQDEAELAAALAHELGHLRAGHALVRLDVQRRGRAADVLEEVLSAPPPPPPSPEPRTAAMMVDTRASLSFRQELEADRLGAGYLALAGYDARAMARMLERLGAYDRLHLALEGRPALAASNRLGERVAAAAVAGAVLGPPGRSPRAELLEAIDGLAWGPSVERGFTDGRLFVHPTLALSFAVPRGFEVASGRHWALGRGADGLLLVVDRPERASRSPRGTRQMRRHAASSPAIEELGTLLETPTGTHRLRFLQLGPFSSHDHRAMRTVFDSVRPLSTRTLSTIRQAEVRVVAVAPGTPVAELAARMDVPAAPIEVFRLLNGLGDDVKTVAEAQVRLVRPAAVPLLTSEQRAPELTRVAFSRP